MSDSRSVDLGPDNYAIVSSPDAAQAEPDMAVLRLSDLSAADRAAIWPFIVAKDVALGGGPVEALIDAGNRGCDAYVNADPSLPAGWRKYLVYVVSKVGVDLWERFHLAEGSDPYLTFAVRELERRGWGPDGNSDGLGRQHQYCMGTLIETGWFTDDARRTRYPVW